MKTTVYLLVASTLLFGSTSALSQDAPPASSVVRTMNCRLNDGIAMSDLIEAARTLPRDANSPDLTFVRDAIMASPEYRQNWDFQVATVYPSYQEMSSRRAARRANPLTSDQVSPAAMSTCGDPWIVDRHNVRSSDNLTATNAMVTRLCERTGSTRAEVHSRIAEIAENYASGGADLFVSIDTPGVGGSINLTASQFILRVVGPGITQMLDLRRTGSQVGGGDGGFSCNRWSGWRTDTVSSAATN